MGAADLSTGADTAYGVSLGLWQDRDPLEAIPTARLADALGYSELWIGEMATFDAFALATAVGQATERIPLCVGPLATGVRTPMGMAMGAASVAALAQRPVGLAVGSSSPVVVAAWHGREWSRTAHRLEETVTALRPLLAGERASVDGELARTHGYRLRLPAPASPVTVAAFGEAAVRVAARLGDRMVFNLVTPEAVAGLVQRAEQVAEAAGRPRPRVACWVATAVEPCASTRVQLSSAILGYLAAPGYGEMFAAAGFEELVATARAGAQPSDLLAQIPRELTEKVAAVGSAHEVRARLGEYRAAGVDDIVIVPATAGDDSGRRTLETLAG